MNQKTTEPDAEEILIQEFFQSGKEISQQLDEQQARRRLVDISKECLTPECDA